MNRVVINMAGLSWSLVRTLGLLSLSLLLGSCAVKPTFDNVNGHLSNPKVLLVNTNSHVERYRVAEQAFVNALPEVSMSKVNLEADRYPIDTLQDIFNAEHYDLVYCIGAKSLGAVDYIDPELPVVFSSVLNWHRFDGQRNYYGIASEVASEAQLTWFKYFFPNLNKLGVLYSEFNKGLIINASTSAKQLSMTLVSENVSSRSQLLANAENILSEVDALWLVSDPTILASTDQIKQLFELAKQRNVPVFAYGQFFVEMGATLTIEADLPTTGRQAALMAQNILQGAAQSRAMQFPAGTSITLNLKKARTSRLTLNESALGSVSELVEFE